MSGHASESDRVAAAFAREVERDGFPDYGVRCRHGVQGGLHCKWCGNPDRLPASEQVRGVPRGSCSGVSG